MSNSNIFEQIVKLEIELLSAGCEKRKERILNDTLKLEGEIDGK